MLHIFHRVATHSLVEVWKFSAPLLKGLGVTEDAMFAGFEIALLDPFAPQVTLRANEFEYQVLRGLLKLRSKILQGRSY